VLSPVSPAYSTNEAGGKVLGRRPGDGAPRSLALAGQPR